MPFLWSPFFVFFYILVFYFAVVDIWLYGTVALSLWSARHRTLLYLRLFCVRKHVLSAILSCVIWQLPNVFFPSLSSLSLFVFAEATQNYCYCFQFLSKRLMDHFHGISAQGLKLVQPNATYYPSPPKAVPKGGKKKKVSFRPLAF